MAASWRPDRPRDRAWRPEPGLSPSRRADEQDRAAGGRDRRMVRIADGRVAAGSIALRVQPRRRRIYAYLRWSDNGRTVERYVGEACHGEREANLAEAWRQAQEADMVGQPPSTTRSHAPSRSAADSWASSPAVRSVMKGNKGRDTEPEMALRSAVHALGMRYRTNIRPVPSLRRSADLVFTRAKVAVFMDGCFWHGCPDHHRPARTNAEFWRTKIDANRARDTETDAALVGRGWTVIRVWEHSAPGGAARLIAEAVQNKINI
jgi:DNA mismatch endonuclease, patch repair protein